MEMTQIVKFGQFFVRFAPSCGNPVNCTGLSVLRAFVQASFNAKPTLGVRLQRAARFAELGTSTRSTQGRLAHLAGTLAAPDRKGS
jgi:hypothetical protein